MSQTSEEYLQLWYNYFIVLTNHLPNPVELYMLEIFQHVENNVVGLMNKSMMIARHTAGTIIEWGYAMYWIKPMRNTVLKGLSIYTKGK